MDDATIPIRLEAPRLEPKSRHQEVVLRPNIGASEKRNDIRIAVLHVMDDTPGLKRSVRLTGGHARVVPIPQDAPHDGLWSSQATVARPRGPWSGPCMGSPLDTEVSRASSKTMM